MGTHPIFESDFDCLTENEKLTEMSNQEIDQAIMATQEEIQDKIKTEIPLIGERIPLNSLSDDFSGDDLFLENLNGQVGEVKRVKSLMKSTRDFLIDTLSYPDISVDDFYETVSDFVEELGELKSSEELITKVNEPGISNYIVCWMRLVASAELQKQPDFYINFLPNVASVHDFCRLEVEPLGVDIDHVVITALATGLETPVKVACLERTPGKAQIVEFFGEDAKINLMFRPGHYDILYK